MTETDPKSWRDPLRRMMKELARERISIVDAKPALSAFVYKVTVVLVERGQPVTRERLVWAIKEVARSDFEQWPKPLVIPPTQKTRKPMVITRCPDCQHRMSRVGVESKSFRVYDCSVCRTRWSLENGEFARDEGASI